MTPRLITHRELREGDCVSLEFANGGWENAKVTRIANGIATLFRPWMSSDDNYPRIGIEIFTVYTDSDKTVQLIGRDG